MSDPKRLLDGDTTELERLLLSAVARERPSRALSRRMRSAIGLAGSLLTFKAAAAALTIAAVVGGASAVIRRADDAPVADAPPVATVRERAIPVAPKEVPPPATQTPATQAAPVEALPVAPAPPAQKTQAGPALPDLRDQMRLLEKARGALRDGAPGTALTELDRYRKSYPRGAFAQEASVLRIEALRRSGQQGLAATLARDFIRRYPESPHVERLSQSLEPGPSKL